MRPTVGFISLGCPKNLVDTERMMDIVSRDSDAILTGNHSSADIVVINTCGFLEPAKLESMSTIKEFIDLKKAKKIKGVVVTGCMTERYLGEMKTSYPAVDAFLPTKSFSEISHVVDEIMNGEGEKLRERQRLVGELPNLRGNSELPDYSMRSEGLRSFAYVKISEGCNRTCSFCIIPKLRGKHHSRSIAGVVDEVRQLVSHGTKEIVFIAQDLTSYGRDRGDGASLLSLLAEIEDVDGLEWYRLMYNYPRFFTDELIDLLASSRKFSGYLDIPFQHISDPVLKLMNRPESGAEIKSLVHKLRSRIPGIFLRTTVMVGFPGETDENFNDLLNFVRESSFDHLGAFTYWREEGTPSYDLPDQVEDEIKKKRYSLLMKSQQKLSKEKLKGFLGQILDVRIDALSEAAKDGFVYRGRHRGQAPEVDGLTYVFSDRKIPVGQVLKAEINKIVGDYDLLGRALTS